MAGSQEELVAWVGALQAAMGQDGGGSPAAPSPRAASSASPSPRQPGSVRPRPPAGRSGSGLPSPYSAAASPSSSPMRGPRRRATAAEALGGGAATAAALSPLGARRSTSLGHDPSFLSPMSSGGMGGAPGSGAGTPTGSAGQPAVARRRSLLHAVADVFGGGGGGASPAASPAARAQLPSSGELAFLEGQPSGYGATLRPLASGRPPMRVLMERLGASLPHDSLSEQYDRALLFVINHSAEFSTEKLEILQAGWRQRGWRVQRAGEGAGRAALACLRLRSL